MNEAVWLRPFEEEDAGACAQILHAAVHALAGRHYSTAQRAAWAPAVMSADALLERLHGQQVFIAFTGSINWYRNLDRNWHILAGVNPIIGQPALMIYGDRDVIPKSERLAHFVPNVDVVLVRPGCMHPS